MFGEIAFSIKPPADRLSLVPSIEDRAIWEEPDPSIKKYLIRAGETCLDYSYPAIRATDYMAFCRTGDREVYQNKAFRRRIVLNTLVLAECIENRGRFLDDIINGIFSVCEESAWQIPAHNSYFRDAPQLILPDIENPVIDLFAAETGAILGVICILLRPRLDMISPFIRTMVSDNLHRRIITPYLNEHFWWMGDGIGRMNNWTPWCTQNILLTAASCELAPSVQEAIFRQACTSADYFLAGYGEDGCCDEGAQYFRHAGLCLFTIIEIMNKMTDGAFLPLYQVPKIRNIASYVYNVHADDRFYFNFADCSPVAGRCNAREFLFGKRTGNQSLMAFAADDFRRSEAPLLPEEHGLYDRLQAVFHYREMLAFSEPVLPARKDCYYESVGLWIAGDETFRLAVKAGGNHDSHNHNDTGSFILYRHGRPMFIDVGVETYTRKTFSPERYELWTMQSGYHNLLTFGGSMQAAGKPYAAREVSVSFDDFCSAISMELAGAYSDARIYSYRRQVVFVKGSHITIRDEVAADSKPIVLSLMTHQKPSWHAAAGQLQIGCLGSCLIRGSSKITIERIPITDERLAPVWGQELYRTLVVLANHKLELMIPA